MKTIEEQQENCFCPVRIWKGSLCKVKQGMGCTFKRKWRDCPIYDEIATKLREGFLGKDDAMK